MRDVDDSAVSSDTHVVADRDARMANDVNILLDIYVVTDAQLGDPRWRADDCIEAYSVIDAYATSKMDETGIVQRDGIDDDAAFTHRSEDVAVKEAGLSPVISELKGTQLLKERRSPELLPASHQRPRHMPEAIY